MRTEAGHVPLSGPSRFIIRWALNVGAVAFVAGFVGPALFSPSNLGPLLGIFITGPVGVLAGALWGVTRAAAIAEAPHMRAVLAWLCAVCIMTLLYTLFMMGMATEWALPSVGLQGAVIVGTAYVLDRRRTRTGLPQVALRVRPVVVALLAAIMIMTLFPPVTRPWWGRPTARQRADAAAPLPKVAFILDRRFDASRRIPVFAVDRRLLVLGWAVSALAAIAAGGVMIGRYSATAP